MRGLEETDGPLIEPVIVEEAECSPRQYGDALGRRTQNSEEDGHDEPQRDYEFDGEILLQLKNSPPAPAMFPVRNSGLIFLVRGLLVSPRHPRPHSGQSQNKSTESQREAD